MVEVTKALQEEMGILAREAGAIILSIREAGINPERKQDNTPVTEADKAADRHISDTLKTRFAIPVISEEGGYLPDASTLPEQFWLVDPLDGTNGFIRGGKNFTVNIALVKNHRAVFGVIYSPVYDELYVGAAGQGAFLEKEGKHVPISMKRGKPPTALISSHHCKNENAILTHLFEGINLVPKSSSIKFCKVADGSADLYFRIGETSEWDTAAGQAILEAAGGKTLAYPSGEDFIYGKPYYRNSGVIAGHPEMVDAVIAAYFELQRKSGSN